MLRSALSDTHSLIPFSLSFYPFFHTEYRESIDRGLVKKQASLTGSRTDRRTRSRLRSTPYTPSTYEVSHSVVRFAHESYSTFASDTRTLAGAAVSANLKALVLSLASAFVLQEEKYSSR